MIKRLLKVGRVDVLRGGSVAHGCAVCTCYTDGAESAGISLM